MSGSIAALTIFALVGSGLVAGTFFAFSTFIMQAFARRPAEEAAAAMNEVNVVILRSPFIAVFIGTAIASLVLAAYSLLYPASTGGYLLIAGATAYLVPCFGVTMAFNVPLNNKLAAVGPTDVVVKAVWDEYLESWTRWNHVRTVGGLLAAVLFASSLIY